MRELVHTRIVHISRGASRPTRSLTDVRLARHGSSPRSGAGKSTLLDLVADRLQSGTMSGAVSGGRVSARASWGTRSILLAGSFFARSDNLSQPTPSPTARLPNPFGLLAQVHVNKEPRDAGFRVISSYVPQHDALTGVLTVRETLRFSAELAGITDPEEITRMVNNTAANLGLQTCIGAVCGACGMWAASQTLSICRQLSADAQPPSHADRPQDRERADQGCLWWAKAASLARRGVVQEAFDLAVR